MEQKKVCQFDVKDLLPIGFVFVTFGIALTYGLNVLSDVQDDIGESNCAARSDGNTSFNETSNLCYDGQGATPEPATGEFNATADALSGVGKLPEKMPLIATVVVAAIIISILVRYLMLRFT